ncbi:MAG: hypothetical protein L3J84_02075 [Gammaproteobacteria bacterium]|nr:hypothetical protein [Gammaproteobacteria bacterium]
MPRLHLVEHDIRTLSDFVATRCPEIKEAQRETARQVLAKYNGRHPDNPFTLPNDSLVVPDNLPQRLLIPATINFTPTLRLTQPEVKTLSALLAKYSAGEILSMAQIADTLPASEDTLKAFAGGLLGASRSRGKGYLQALQVYNDSLVEWKNTPKAKRNKIKAEKVQPAHDRLSKAYKSELHSMTPHGLHPLKGAKQGMRLLRGRQRSIELSNTEESLRLKRFLKMARVSAYGAIIIDAGLVGQKVQQARDAGENAEKVAYEEYGALVVGILGAGFATAFLGPGLLILTVAGGVGALLGAEGGRWIGELLYEQISTYEAAVPPERKKQLLSDAVLSVL